MFFHLAGLDSDGNRLSRHPSPSAIALLLHRTLSPMDTGKGNYVRATFVNYSSAFNTTVPSRLVSKLHDLDLDSLCRWVYSILTSRPQVVQLGHHTLYPLTFNTGSPRGLCPLLYTHDYRAPSDSNVILNCADNIAVVALTSYNNEAAYRREVSHLENHLLFNINKPKELIADFSRKQHFSSVALR